MPRYIDAEVALQSFCAECNHTIKCEDCDTKYHLEEFVPTADVQEVRHGKKKVYYHGENTFSYTCDQCAMPIDGMYAFCRWCGAKMDEEEEDG